ncbi:MAG: heat shock protein Hsp90 [Verrucomicrobiales bacterium]|nr:heat shock protein Hsp90 [Verrucomicrobiales bacterium]
MSTDTVTHQPFQAEVRQLLDIVINSLYTDREIFVRELVSNAADSLEKLRHLRLTEPSVFESEKEPEIEITSDAEAKTLTITDYGIGMTREELIRNLGTIAHSGTKAFLQNLEAGAQAAGNVIGRFGVGFYSVFMVADRVEVFTHSWREDGESLLWTSDGRGGFDVAEAPGQHRGCRIVIHLKEEHAEFAAKGRVKTILERYSNFVPFPILLDGERVNNVEALWLKKKSEVTDEQYNEFYKFIAHAWDEPRYRLHFSADAPLVINSLLFIPQENPERYGMGQMEPGVALYCRRVLIDPKPRGLLPEWLRFAKGVIDSDDLPLNISRESMQDSALVQKLGDVLTKRLIKMLEGEARDNAEKYNDFYKAFSRFLKEGVAVDDRHRAALSKLLRFESSLTEPGVLTGFDEYLSRAKDGQKDIYFLIAPSRAAIEAGPYLEAFKARGLEVIYLFEPIDEYVVSSLSEVEGKRLVSAASDDLDLGDAPPTEGESLTEEQTKEICEWLKETLGDSVESVRAGSRLVSSPAVALQPEGQVSPQMRAMMKAMNQDFGGGAKVVLEINPRHNLIRKLALRGKKNDELAPLIAEQIRDNALIAAGLLDSPTGMLARMEKVLAAAL